jgi:uncharacterized protein with FMN-binding domain
MRKKVKIMIIITSIVLVIGVGFGLSYLKRYNDYKSEVADIEINEVNLSQIDDGVYVGEYDVDFISAKVQVEVKDNEIKDIEFIEYHHDRGKKAKSILQNMVDEQRIDVDTITGATNSSKVIQKAVENALSGS